MKSINPMMNAASRVSKRLVFSYLIDWAVIIGIAIVGGLFYLIHPYHRPFSLVDASISYPYVEKEKVSTAVLVVISIIVPAAIILLVCLLLVPISPTSKGLPKSVVWRRALWEWNTGWMGLALSLTTSFMLVDGMKKLFGKPRPDLLSRCLPDLANAQNYAIGGYSDITNAIILVSSTICQQKDRSILDDGFQSFPSGHSIISWAGLAYLTFFLCSKFAIYVPYLLPYSYAESEMSSKSYSNVDGHFQSEFKDSSALTANSSRSPSLPLRNQAAAPPVYLIVMAFIPVAVATYISSSRYTDFRHAGFDIIFGSILGFLLAWGSYRMYHMPIRRGAGWSWGPRSAERAFIIGLGVQGYVEQGMVAKNDVELGNRAYGNGRQQVLTEDTDGTMTGVP